MVGFVLIVVLVVVAMMVFLVISSRQPTDARQSIQAENLISVLMSSTTECAISYEPEYDNVRELIKSCYENKKCSNLDRMACDYLDEYLKKVLGDVMATESAISAYEIEIYFVDEEETSLSTLFEDAGGSCESSVFGAFETINVEGGTIRFTMDFCYNG